MSTTEIKALIDLLLDDDPRIHAAACERLAHLGPDAIEALDSAANADDARLRVRARELLHALQGDTRAAELRELLRSPEIDLEAAMTKLASIEHHDLIASDVTDEIDRLGQRVRAHQDDTVDPRERAMALGRVLHEDEGFRGNDHEYYDPRNSYIDQVLARRVGIPISLAAVYILAGRRAGLDVRGVGMPTHFLAVYIEDREELLIDAYAGGRLMTREACKTLLAGYRQRFREEYLRPVTDRAILRRMMVNLVHIYNKRKDHLRVGRLYRLIETLQDS